MKRKLLFFVCVLIVFMVGAFACEKADDNSNDTTPDQEATDESQNDESVQNEQCTSPNDHNYVEVSRIDALALKDGEIKYECSHCKRECFEKIPATKSLKILALGNSFTDDSTWHLWNICKDAGVENLIVANLYVGNCNLDQHWNYIASSKNPYEYRKTTTGTRVEKKTYRVIDALKDEDWDFIVLHQTSGSAGQANTFGKLDAIINFMNTNKTNPDAKIIWHMPWAYEGDSTHGEFPKYGNDQMNMYEMIVARVKQIIIPKKTIFDIIPSGTAIQNLRTSYIGDNVTRDGYHLSYGFGRYTAALTWYAILTGGDVDSPDWIPTEYPDVEIHLPAIREAVKGALESNFAVTESNLKGDETLATLNGVDLSNYDLLSWDYINNGYWNCSDSTKITRPTSASTNLYNTNICVNRKYSIEELPAGTIFICDNGWRFRIEQYPTENEKYTGTRHDGCTDMFFVLTEEFLNDCTYVAWSVSTNPREKIDTRFDAAYSHVRIYVPHQHDYIEVDRTEPLALKDGEIKYLCTGCKEEYVETIPATKSLKILAIGNSFTQDSTTYLWGICHDAGVTNELVVANLYTGNCNLNTHWNNISNNGVYQEYQKYTSENSTVSKETHTFKDALLDEDWDIIVLHQTSGSAGQAETFTNLDNIIKFVNDNKTNPDAKILWHMPWAYQGDSTHSEFSKYNNDQMNMYETILARVKEIILPKNTISTIIPTATSIQNLRTSYVGDNVTRDGYHLGYGLGRYTAALTWYAVLTGGDVDVPDWVPSGYSDVAMHLPAIRDAVKSALENSFAVTPSGYQGGDELIAEIYGVDLNDYELLEWNYVKNGFWNCSDSTDITIPASTSKDHYNKNICVNRKYSIEELPVGTIFICDNGWRFRIEQYPTENEKYTGSRHGGCTDMFFELTDEFLNGCTYLAWSVSTNPRAEMSAKLDAAYTHVRIYVPKS